MKRNILGIILSFLAISTTLVVVVFALLVDKKNTPKITFKSGKVVYTLEGSSASGLVVPGQNLISEAFTLTNQSTIDSQLRFKILIVLNDETLELSDERVINDITANIGSDFEFNNDDQYYYFGGTSGVVSKTNHTPFTIVSEVILDGAFVKNEYADKIVKISFVFEAKQSDHVTWDVLGTEDIDFSTGK